MRIAFEVSSLISRKPTGVSNYIKNFVENFAALDGDFSLKLIYKLTRIKHKKNFQSIDRLPMQFYHNSLLPVFKNTDIVHGLDCWVPNWKNCKKIVNFYDIFPMIDQRDFISQKSFREKKDAEYRTALAHADLVITSSDSTKNDIADYYQTDETKITTIYPGLDSDFFRKKDCDEIKSVLDFHNIKNNYLLFVGSVSARKNTANLVEAYAISKANTDFDLVFAGSVSFNGEYTLEAIKKYNLEDKVKILGYVPENHIAALYSGAKGFVFPTFYEGFGFPILEAMLCETPVLTGNVGSAPEIGGEYAIYSDPHDIDSIAAGIDKLVEKKDFDIARAKVYAQQFTWEKTARNVLDIYRSLMIND